MGLPSQYTWRHGGIGSVNERSVDIFDVGAQHRHEGAPGENIRHNAGTNSHPYASHAGSPLPDNMKEQYTA